MEGDLRVVGARLDAQVAVASAPGRSPRPAAAAGRRSGARALGGEAEAVVAVALEQAGPEAEGDREPAGQVADRLAGVVGRRERLVVVRPGGLAGGHPGRGLGPGPQQVDELGAARGDDVERGEVEPVLRRA